MSEALRKLRASPVAAWAGPLILFMGIMFLGGQFKVETAGAPWWRLHPEQWAYPLQVLLCGAWLLAFRPHYHLGPLRAGHAVLAVAAGLGGIAIWLLPGWLFARGLVPEIRWLGCTARLEGFDPSLWDGQPALWWTVVLLRFVRMTLIVPFVEELFWRGFLWRTLADDTRDFHKVALGLPGARPFWITAALVAVAHMGPDLAVALVWGILTGLVHVRTRSIAPVILMHAVANLALGLHVMLTRQWGYW